MKNVTDDLRFSYRESIKSIVFWVAVPYGFIYACRSERKLPRVEECEE
jgi:hypothetical protein